MEDQISRYIKHNIPKYREGAPLCIKHIKKRRCREVKRKWSQIAYQRRLWELRFWWRGDCTFSSSSEKNLKKRKRAKKPSTPPSAATRRDHKFRGVRQHRWPAEIRDPNQRRRVWLGTFDTAEEAATEHDKAAVKIKGPNAITNFPNTAKEEATTPPPGSDGRMGFQGF